jgi:hypothetical protein
LPHTTVQRKRALRTLRQPGAKTRQACLFTGDPGCDSEQARVLFRDQAAPLPFLLAERAGSEWVQPITFDPTAGWTGASSSSSLRSPLWPMRASGDVGVPRAPSRAEQENVAVGAVVGAGLFAAALLHAFGVWR